MARSTTNYQEFLHRMRREHLPKSDRFEVEIGGCAKLGKNYLVTLMCEEAQIPGLSVNNAPYKIGPWTEYRSQNLEFLSTEVVFTFLVDESWSLRAYFETWINHSVNMKSKEVGFYHDITADVFIKSLDTQDRVIGKWRLIEAMPKLLNITPVSWGNGNQLRMSLSMTAKRWTNEMSSYENTKSSETNNAVVADRGWFGGIIDKVKDEVIDRLNPFD